MSEEIDLYIHIPYVVSVTLDTRVGPALLHCASVQVPFGYFIRIGIPYKYLSLGAGGRLTAFPHHCFLEALSTNALNLWTVALLYWWQEERRQQEKQRNKGKRQATKLVS